MNENVRAERRAGGYAEFRQDDRGGPSFFSAVWVDTKIPFATYCPSFSTYFTVARAPGGISAGFTVSRSTLTTVPPSNFIATSWSLNLTMIVFVFEFTDWTSPERCLTRIVFFCSADRFSAALTAFFVDLSGACPHATYSKPIEIRADMKRYRIFTGSPVNECYGWKREYVLHLFDS